MSAGKTQVASVLSVTAIVVLLAVPATAQEQGEWRYGGRLIRIDVDAVSEPLADNESKVGVDSSTSLEFDTTYMLGDNWGLEWMITAAPHDASVVDGVFSGLDLGSLWVAETSVTITYSIPLRGRWRPYIGAGVGAGYVVYSDETSEAETIGVEDINSNVAWGPVAQLGLAHRLNRSWILSLDVKWMDMPMDVRVEDLDGNRQTVEMDLDPLIIGLGAAYRF